MSSFFLFTECRSTFLIPAGKPQPRGRGYIPGRTMPRFTKACLYTRSRLQSMSVKQYIRAGPPLDALPEPYLRG